MSEQNELLSDAFHLLAQPIMALRARVELGLVQPLDENKSRQLLESCLVLMDRLTGELALVRELVTQEDGEAPLARCDGRRMVEEIAGELAPVAEEAALLLESHIAPASLLVSETALRRALFVLLDATLGTAHKGGHVTLALRRAKGGAETNIDAEKRYELELRPGVPPGARRELCRKLLRRAGGEELALEDDRTVAEFRAAAPEEKIEPARRAKSRDAEGAS